MTSSIAPAADSTYVGIYSITNIPPEYAKAPFEGYDKDLFICPVCLCAIIEPIVNSSCSHILCLDCYQRIVAAEEEDDELSCPVCRRVILTYTTAGYATFSPLLHRLLDMVIYSCPAAGCSFSGSLTSIKNHFRLCPKLEVLCPNAGCNAKGPREIMHRDHNPVCQDGFIRCLICSNFVPRRKMEEHKCPVQILRVFGRGEAILAGSRKHFVQRVRPYSQPCFYAADIDNV